jgi:hypothetical protein
MRFLVQKDEVDGIDDAAKDELSIPQGLDAQGKILRLILIAVSSRLCQLVICVPDGRFKFNDALPDRDLGAVKTPMTGGYELPPHVVVIMNPIKGSAGCNHLLRAVLARCVGDVGQGRHEFLIARPADIQRVE